MLRHGLVLLDIIIFIYIFLIEILTFVRFLLISLENHLDIQTELGVLSIGGLARLNIQIFMKSSAFCLMEGEAIFL